jgi:hypothetical protein
MRLPGYIKRHRRLLKCDSKDRKYEGKAKPKDTAQTGKKAVEAEQKEAQLHRHLILTLFCSRRDARVSGRGPERVNATQPRKSTAADMFTCHQRHVN